MSFSLIFRLVIFLILLGLGYSISRRIRQNKISLTLVGVLVLFFVAGFAVLTRKIFAMAGFTLYLLLIVLGFGIGLLAGLRKDKD